MPHSKKCQGIRLYGRYSLYNGKVLLNSLHITIEESVHIGNFRSGRPNSPFREDIMKILQVTTMFIALVIALSGGLAHAKADTVALYTEAVMTGDVPALETLLAPNYWHINANGHIEDKEHFINTIKSKELVIDRLTFTNARTALISDAKLITGTGYLKAKATPALPEGLMRITVVVITNKGREQVVLFQATPVIATEDCNDGNCKIQ